MAGKRLSQGDLPSQRPSKRRAVDEQNNSQNDIYQDEAQTNRMIDCFAENTMEEDNSVNEEEVTEEEEQTNEALLAAPEVGVIELLILKNFMCHDHLQVEFSNMVNFITGPNGSGKSAILSGLQVALGASATKTMRGTSLGDLVKMGQNSATVTVHLRNRGSDAYKHSEYGNTIQVSRYITNKGVSTFSIKNDRGYKISSKASELRNIIDHFHIEIDNPCAILLQDISRNYLHNTNPKVKYEFFLDATGLKSHWEHLDHVATETEKIDKILDSIAKRVVELSRARQEAHRRYQMIGRVTELKRERDGLERSLAWYPVKEAENKILGLEQDINQKERRIAEGKRKLSDSEERKVNLQLQVDSFKKEFEELQDQRGQEDTVLITFERKVQEEHNKMLKAQRAAKTIRHMIGQKTQRLGETREKIEELLTAQSHDYRQQKEQQEREITAATFRRDEVGREFDRLRGQEKDLQQRLAAMIEGGRQHAQEIRECRDEEQRLKRELEEMTKMGNNRYGVFGREIVALLKAIQANQTRFNHTPIGPIGLHVKVTDPEWIEALEYHLRNVLSSFIVFSKQDEALLNKLAARINPKLNLQVFVKKQPTHEFYRIRSPQCANVRAVASALTSEDPNVFNLLVDVARIDSVGLAISGEALQQTLSQSRRHRDAGFTDGYALDGELLHMALKGTSELKYYKNRREIMSRAKLTQDMREHQQRLTGLLNDKHQQMQGLLERERAEKSQTNDANAQLKTLRSQLHKLQRDINRLEAQISTLQQFEEPEIEGTEAYELQVSELEEEINELKQTLGDDEANLKERTEAYERVMAEKKEAEGGLEESRRQFEAVRKELANHANLLLRANKAVQHYTTQIAHVEKELEDLRKEKAVFQSALDAQLPNALRICGLREKPQAYATEPLQQVKERIRLLDVQIANEERLRGNSEEITNDYMAKNEEYQKKKTQKLMLETTRDLLKETLSTRKLKLREFRDLLKHRLRWHFSRMVRARGYQGDLRLLFNEATLEVEVYTDEKQAKAAKKRKEESRRQNKKFHAHVGSLSGGERSFSTVALLLSLWGVCAFPRWW
eukprot:GCRY01002152.1.p1 GENE.GCRY01002152.1~~GCRY01002152.1.p1  ORF type:complete len:1072 (+),score=363.11 GCRY01002152.1:220-3435(+)